MSEENLKPDLAGLAAREAVDHPEHYQGRVECWDTMADLAERYENRSSFAPFRSKITKRRAGLARQDDRGGRMMDKQTESRRAKWDTFRDEGLLWWVNRILHTFGWSIVVEPDGTAYPERTDCLGFADETNRRRLAQFKHRIEPVEEEE